MIGYRGSRFATLFVAAALVQSGNVLAQQSGLPPLPTVPNAPQPAPLGLPSIDLPPSPAPAQAPLVTLGIQQPPPIPSPPPVPTLPSAPRFTFKIEPNAPVKDLLPLAPKVAPVRGPLLTDDLTKVPEAEFEVRPETIPMNNKLTELTALQLARINHLNAKKTDAFMVALRENRPDLAGLPFAMGDDCRTGPERAKAFTQAVATVRAVMMRGDAFWSHFKAVCEQQDAAHTKTDKALAEHVAVARIAALMQMLAPESAEVRTGLVKYLSAVSHVEATRALAKLAIFSTEDDVRNAAVDALKVRREKDYTDILVKGLRYPFPAVAKRSADAIARMGRTDLVPELIAVLEEEDPRMPQVKKGAKKTVVVREMVRVNHHRNCMLCHAPGTSGVATASAVTAEVPIQGHPLPTPAQGYQQATPSPDLMIRIDVTYLRQDFSVMLAVAESHPWPELQRFDFLVRERTLTAAEALTYREKLTPKETGVLSPYHRAALASLRELTGKDTTPTAAAWRQLLDTPAKPVIKPCSEEEVKPSTGEIPPG